MRTAVKRLIRIPSASPSAGWLRARPASGPCLPLMSHNAVSTPFKRSDDNTLRTVVAQARIDHLPEKRYFADEPWRNAIDQCARRPRRAVASAQPTIRWYVSIRFSNASARVIQSSGEGIGPRQQRLKEVATAACDLCPVVVPSFAPGSTCRSVLTHRDRNSGG